MGVGAELALLSLLLQLSYCHEKFKDHRPGDGGRGDKTSDAR